MRFLSSPRHDHPCRFLHKAMRPQVGFMIYCVYGIVRFRNSGKTDSFVRSVSTSICKITECGASQLIYFQVCCICCFQRFSGLQDLIKIDLRRASLRRMYENCILKVILAPLSELPAPLSEDFWCHSCWGVVFTKRFCNVLFQKKQ